MSGRVPRINDVFHHAVVSAGVARSRLRQRLDEVPFTVHVDHADLQIYTMHQ